ncbi:WD40 repeat domain-containing protein [Desulfurobacterium indicum]|nr:WD40 repeat domain-containing protein [Desulfurobacterium indicum]
MVYTKLLTQPGFVNSIDFSNEGSYLISAGKGGAVVKYNFAF